MKRTAIAILAVIPLATGDIWGLGKALSARGINVFMFDFRGCFESEGKQGLMNSQEDIEAALRFLGSDEMAGKYRVDPSRIVVGGYSYGGHMSMLYAAHHPEVPRVMSISGGDLGALARIIRTDPDVRKGYADIFQSLRKPRGPVEFEYEHPLDELLDNEAFFSIRTQAAKLSGTDILMTGGLDDQVVSMEDHLLPLYRALERNRGQKLRFIVYQADQPSGYDAARAYPKGRDVAQVTNAGPVVGRRAAGAA
jgi:pimeloyl-ACP methyl ester carboxylesterase